MRFGLSDLGDLPSLKEFEQLARQALGADEGISPIEPEDISEGLPEDISAVDFGTEAPQSKASISSDSVSDATGSSGEGASQSQQGEEPAEETSGSHLSDKPRARAADSKS